jgi:two-component system cell cycle sensor histidine kinase/response regulator CckA
MEMLGRLAAGIAHDFNNLLTVVRTGAEVLAMQYPDDPLVTHVVEASDRAAGLTGKLVDLARRRRAPLAEVDLNAILTDMQAMIRSSVPSTVTIESDLDPEPVVVFGDRDQLEQVVLNLVLNARDAMPQGGRLSLRTRNVGDDVLLDVEDTGHGMSAEVAEQIFEPFFTTKEGRGTGLGLASVRELVAQHRGDIGVESAPGAGSRFRVRLPRARPPAPA